MRHIISQLSLFVCIALGAAQAQPVKINFSDPIPMDQTVITGKLSNGLTYYIKQNPKPENRVELRLAVNAGSVLETPGQLGLAHFLEHMAFNGTKNFPKNELVSSLQKMGVEFGADINAYTSFDETVYMLQVPADNMSLIDEGFQILEDWAHQLTLDGEEIDKERGIIIEEWRMGLGANDRLRRAYLPVIFSGSIYADRLPIGNPEIIQNFKHDTIRAFYRDWYRPDLQAIIVVGDIDPKLAEAKIIEHFSKIPVHDNPLPRVVHSVPGNKDPLVLVATDKEATNNSLMLFYKHPKMETRTIEDFRRDLVYELYTGMLNSRMSELNQKAGSPLINSSTYYGRFMSRSMHAYVNQAIIKSNQIAHGFEMIVTENERVRKYGFLLSELDRQKLSLTSSFERRAKEEGKTESGRLTREYISHFLDNEPMPGASWELQMAAMLLPGITLEEVNALASSLITDENMVLVVTAPEKDGLSVPNEKELLSIFARARNTSIEPWTDSFRDEPLISAQLNGSRINKAKVNPQSGLEEITLKNGIKVYLKHTDFKNDEVLFMAVSSGGYSLYPESDHMSHSQAASIISQSGLGQFSNIELQKKLKGKVVSLNPFVGELTEGFRGNARPADLETLLQLLYLNFTEPRKDSESFNTFIAATESRYQYMSSNPTSVFFDTLFKVASSNNPRTKVLLSIDDIKSIDHQKAFEFYKQRFANASDFRFFFVGNFDRSALLPLIEKYIGSLPETKDKENWKDTNKKFPAGKTEITVNAGLEPKAMVALMFSEPIEWNDQNRLHLNLLKEILDIKITEVIREEMSGVYSPSISQNLQKNPRPEMSLNIMFGCSPGNTDNLTQAVLGEMNKIIENGPSAEDLTKARETVIRRAESEVKTNRYWLDRMYAIYYLGDSYSNIDTLKAKVAAVSTDDLRLSASKYWKTDHYLRGILLPE